MKNTLFMILVTGMAGALNGQFVPEAPANLRAAWSAPTASPLITLTWEAVSAPTGSLTGYRIYRRVGGLAWPTAPFAAVAATVNTWTDPLVTDTVLTAALKATNITLSYRVCAVMSGDTTQKRSSEVVTAGNMNVNSNPRVYDTDGDGLSDPTEVALGYNPLDWADASGDSDGDGFPNAWELAWNTDPWLESSRPVVVNPSLGSGSPSVPFLDGSNPAIITVDPSAGETVYVKNTISAALASLAGGSTTNQRFRAIAVRPGAYAENLTFSSSYRIALIPLRSVRPPYSGTAQANPAGIAYDPQEKFELVGVVSASPQRPLLTITGTAVISGFHFSQASGVRAGLLSMGDDVTSTSAAMRLHQVRLVNCIGTAMDTGLNPIISQTRSRLVISQCSLYMNSTDPEAVAHSYDTGIVDIAAASARLQMHNSIFWNPINIVAGKQEFRSIGEIGGAGCTVFDNSLNGVFGQNPGLTPLGFLSGTSTSTYKAGVTRFNLAVMAPAHHKDLHVLRDIHGELRYHHARTLDSQQNPVVYLGMHNNDRGTDLGADQWVDSDGDLIPDAQDRLPHHSGNAELDGDSDLLNELMEFLGSTSLTSADSPFLTLNQARSLFTPLASSPSWASFYNKSEANQRFLTIENAADNYLTRPAADQLYMRKSSNVLPTLRVAPGGNISMGSFTGTAPAP